MIEVFADVSCPFTHFGLRRFVARRDAVGSEVPIRVKAWPLEIVNGAALAGGLVAEEVAALRAQVGPDLYVGMNTERFPTTTLPALALTSLAYARDAALGERVALELRDAIFERGLDVGRPVVLATIAAAHGLDPADVNPEAVLAEYEEGKRVGVVGSPYFLVGGAGYFCPSLDIKRVDGHFRITADLAAFDTFVADALAAG